MYQIEEKQSKMWIVWWMIRISLVQHAIERNQQRIIYVQQETNQSVQTNLPESVSSSHDHETYPDRFKGRHFETRVGIYKSMWKQGESKRMRFYEVSRQASDTWKKIFICCLLLRLLAREILHTFVDVRHRRFPSVLFPLSPVTSERYSTDSYVGV